LFARGLNVGGSPERSTISTEREEAVDMDFVSWHEHREGERDKEATCYRVGYRGERRSESYPGEETFVLGPLDKFGGIGERGDVNKFMVDLVSLFPIYMDIVQMEFVVNVHFEGGCIRFLFSNGRFNRFATRADVICYPYGSEERGVLSELNYFDVFEEEQGFGCFVLKEAKFGEDIARRYGDTAYFTLFSLFLCS